MRPIDHFLCFALYTILIYIYTHTNRKLLNRP